MKRLICCLACVIFFLFGCRDSWSPSAGSREPNPFEHLSLVAPHIHADKLSRFSEWSGSAIPRGDYQSESYEKKRIGTLNLAPDLRVHIDAIRNKVHFPSHYELVDAGSNVVLGKYDVFDLEDAHWYFPGNGTAYINQQHLSLCGPRYTRKLVQRGRMIGEVIQAITYIGAETTAVETTSLFESPTSRKIVATVSAGTKALVLGVQPGESDRTKMALLVKTPLGLTGWHRSSFQPGEGMLDIYQCN